MVKWRKFCSYFLVFILITGVMWPASIEAKTIDGGALSKEESKEEQELETLAVKKGESSFPREYPFANLEEPASIEGFQYQLKDNVEFLPDNTRYNLVPAPVKDIPKTDGTVSTMATKPSTTSTKTYQPGTNLMKFQDAAFVPEANKIYIDKDSQGSYKVIDKATKAGGKVEAPVVNPRVNEVFEGLYIPSQEIAFTKGNIVDMAEGIELVDNSEIRSLAADDYPLPAADNSRVYHEIKIPEYIIYEYPESKDLDTGEPPKGKTESEGPKTSPTPTPHPEDRDAKDTGNSSSMAIKIKLKGGRMRIYEPSLVAELGWDGEFDLGFRSMKIESNIVLEGNITFSKEACIRLYGYGVDFGSGDISAHIGIGIYAVFGINGEITITARVESVGNAMGGVTGNLWAVAVGVPAAVPYAWYDSEKFDVSVKLDAKIHAWAYVGPQVTLDVLDFNLVTLQVWLGVEGDAIVKAEASTNGAESFLMDLNLDFVVLFKAWLFDYSYEKYFVRENIYQNTFQYTSGQSVGGESTKEKDIIPVIKVDGADSYYNLIWGEVYYTDSLGDYVPVANVPLVYSITHNGVTSNRQITTDSEGKYTIQVPVDLRPSDEIMLSVHHEQINGEYVTRFNADLAEKIHPTIPYKIYLLEADGFNDEVVGMVSPAGPCPGYPEPVLYNGSITVYIMDGEGNIIRQQQATVVDGNFVSKFKNKMDLSGGHTAFAWLNFEGTRVQSEGMETNLNALKMNIGCFIDGIDAATVSANIMSRGSKVPTLGIMIKNVELGGTITNLKNKKPYEGEVLINISKPNANYEMTVPVTLRPVELLQSLAVSSNKSITGGLQPKTVNLGPDLKNIRIPMESVSTFEESIGADILGPKGSIVASIAFTIEYEDMTKMVTFPFAINNSEQITATTTNQIDELMVDVIESHVNWPDVMISMGSSEMRINGVMRSIDGGANTSIQMTGGELFIPVKSVVEALGGSFSFNSKSNEITVTLNGKSVSAAIGNVGMNMGGNKMNMTSAPYATTSGTIMIPASLLDDHLGFQVDWDPKAKTLSISKQTTKTTKGESKANKANEEIDLSWNGVWYSDYGALLLIQKGNAVTGTYGEWDKIYKLEGTVKDNRLIGTFDEVSETGTFELTLTDEEGFEGVYRYASDDKDEDDHTWNGIKVSNDFGTTNTNWGGVWYTDFGPMVMRQEGSKITAEFGEKGYVLQGEVSGSVMTGEVAADDFEGEFVLTLSKDRKSIQGEYSYTDDEELYDFYGKRMK